MKITKDIPKKDNKRVKLFRRPGLNIPYLICNHILGKEHKIHHRIAVGSIIMAVGVIISKSGSGVSLIIVHWFLDAFGYLLHGIGTMPFIEYITESVEKSKGNLLQLRTLEEEQLLQSNKEESIIELLAENKEKAK